MRRADVSRFLNFPSENKIDTRRIFQRTDGSLHGWLAPTSPCKRGRSSARICPNYVLGLSARHSLAQQHASILSINRAVRVAENLKSVPLVWTTFLDTILELPAFYRTDGRSPQGLIPWSKDLDAHPTQSKFRYQRNEELQ
jgi:hypothetical protein